MSHTIPLSRLSPVGLAILTALFLLAAVLRAQDAPKPTTPTTYPSGSTFWVGRAQGVTLTSGVSGNVVKKATGITLYGCKTATVYMVVKDGHILSPMWADKSMEITVSNPMFCDPHGRITFYVLPSQDYEIYVIQGRVEAR